MSSGFQKVMRWRDFSLPNMESGVIGENFRFGGNSQGRKM
jgi:hypothetical protein